MTYEYWTVNTARFASFVNPMEDDVWGCGVITVNDVLNCPDISLGQTPSSMTNSSDITREYHIARIAYLSRHGWVDQLNEEIMVYSPEDFFEKLDALSPHDNSAEAKRARQRVRITDGNHRFAAAVIAGIQDLSIEPYGDVESLRTMLGPTRIV